MNVYGEGLPVCESEAGEHGGTDLKTPQSLDSTGTKGLFSRLAAFERENV